MPAFMAGFANDSGIVSAASQHEGHVGVSDEIDFVHRTPGRDMVVSVATAKIGARISPRATGLAVNRVSPLEKIVLQVKSAQIFAVHAIAACVSHRRSRP